MWQPLRKILADLASSWKPDHQIIAGYLILASLHLIITAAIFGSTPWLLTALSGGYAMLYLFGGLLPFTTGVTLAWSTIKDNKRWQKYSLGVSLAYHLFLFILNVINYGGMGTPALPALAFAVLSLRYYVKTIL